MEFSFSLTRPIHCDCHPFAIGQECRRSITSLQGPAGIVWRSSRVRWNFRQIKPGRRIRVETELGNRDTRIFSRVRTQFEIQTSFPKLKITLRGRMMYICRIEAKNRAESSRSIHQFGTVLSQPAWCQVPVNAKLGREQLNFQSRASELRLVGFWIMASGSCFDHGEIIFSWNCG